MKPSNNPMSFTTMMLLFAMVVVGFGVMHLLWVTYAHDAPAPTETVEPVQQPEPTPVVEESKAVACDCGHELEERDAELSKCQRENTDIIMKMSSYAIIRLNRGHTLEMIRDMVIECSGKNWATKCSADITRYVVEGI